MRLNERVARLEAIAPPIAKSLPRTATDNYALLHWVCLLFRLGELGFDDAGNAIAVELKTVNRYNDMPHDMPTLQHVAKAFNGWDSRRRNDGSLGPFLPMMPDEAAKALEMMKAGHVFVADRPRAPNYDRIDALHTLVHPHYYEAVMVSDYLLDALGVYEASGGKVEWTNEAIMDLLSEGIIAHEIRATPYPT